jgi:membrane protein
VLICICIMYYFGPANKKRWRFFSAGSIFAWILSILSTLLFSVYVNNFNSYNKVYGSIGAIIALMILIYINTLVVLVGFDLNTSIEKAAISASKQGNKPQTGLQENTLNTTAE